MEIEDIKTEAALEITANKPRFSKEPILTCAYRMLNELSDAEERLLHRLIIITDANEKNELRLMDKELPLLIGKSESRISDYLQHLKECGYINMTLKKEPVFSKGRRMSWINQRIITINRKAIYGDSDDEKIEAEVLKKAWRFKKLDYIQEGYDRIREEVDQKQKSHDSPKEEIKNEEQPTPPGIMIKCQNGEEFIL